MTLEQVKELRHRTGCAVLDCQAALTEASGDLEQAITILRTKGKAKASKKADRATHEGTIAAYIHGNGKVGVLISLLCETDFVARSERFQSLARDLALHIAAADPQAVSPADIPAAVIATEQAIAEEQAKSSNKPAEIQAKMIAGKLKKFREEKALLTQPFVKDPSKTITDLISEAVSELGENITIADFARLDI